MIKYIISSKIKGMKKGKNGDKKLAVPIGGRRLSAVGLPNGGLLSREEFQKLTLVPPEVEWFANIDNERTRRAYQIDVRDFMSFVGIRVPEDFRVVTRAHVIAWRKLLEQRLVSQQGPAGGQADKVSLSGSTIRRKLSALSSLFEYLCENNAVTHNPVKGVKRPAVESNEGKTPAIGDHQARELLDEPDSLTLKGKRDKAILSVFLYHGLRREELCKLKVQDLTQRRGVPHLRVHGKRSKLRYIPTHPGTIELITDYLEAAGHGGEPSAPLFQPVKDNVSGKTNKAMTTNGVYWVVGAYAQKIGLGDLEGFGVHSLRATAATNALDHEADISKVQEWLGHANIATTRLYDRRKSRPEDSPTFKVNY